jgi:aspartyl-tRNA synthetase
VIKSAEVKSCTVQQYEVSVQKLFTAVEAQTLPFSMADASRDEADFQKVCRPPMLS